MIINSNLRKNRNYEKFGLLQIAMFKTFLMCSLHTYGNTHKILEQKKIYS